MNSAVVTSHLQFLEAINLNKAPTSMSVNGTEKLHMTSTTTGLMVDYVNQAYLQQEIDNWWNWFSSQVIDSFKSSAFGKK